MEQLVIIGFDEIVSNKYIIVIEEAIKNGKISTYSIIDLKSAQKEIDERIARLPVKPTCTVYLDDNHIEPADIDVAFKTIFGKNGDKAKVYIATELRAHLFYLYYCLDNGYDCLVEKPIFAPLEKATLQFQPELIETTMFDLCEKSDKARARVSVMTTGRYHPIYNDILIRKLRERVTKYDAPVTSAHVRVSGGVWNLHREYISREDHPYKYGYGMLMHGAYHYIDVFTQILELNRLIYPEDVLQVHVKTYSAYPTDQNDRIPKKYSSMFDDNDETFKYRYSDMIFGETDFVASLKLLNATRKRVITLGTLAFEQTTTSIRNW